MKDLLGKIAALLLLASAGFNIYIGANVPVLNAVMESLKAKGTSSITNTFQLIAIFVAAGLYGVIGLMVLFVKPIRSMNILMGILVLAMAIALAVVAGTTFQNTKMASTISTSGTVIGQFYGSETGDKFKQSMTAIGVYPAYAGTYGAIAGFIASILIFNRSN